MNVKTALIERLKRRARVYLSPEDVMDRWCVIIGKDCFTMSDNATAPNGVNQWAGSVREIDVTRLGQRMNLYKVPYQVLLGIEVRL